MAQVFTRKKSGGQRKIGRMKVWCAAYKSRNQRNRNKKAKLVKHISKHPNDNTASTALENV
jgi:hypothetical protein